MANSQTAKHKDPLRDAPTLAKREEARQRRRNPNRPINQVMPYLFGIFALLFSVCIFLPKQMGMLGGWITFGLYFLVGRAAILLPLLLINLAIFWRKDRANGQIGWKLTVSVLLMIFVTAVMQLSYLDSTLTVRAAAELQTGAGISGYFFGEMIGYQLLGKVGSVLFYVALILVFLPFLVGATPGEVVRACYKGFCRRRRAAADAKRGAQPVDSVSNTVDPADLPAHAIDLPVGGEPTGGISFRPDPAPTPVPAPAPTPSPAGGTAADGSEDPKAPKGAFFQRKRFAPTSASDLPENLKGSTKLPGAPSTPPPTAGSYLSRSEDGDAAPKAPSVPKMPPLDKQETNDWLSVKSREQFAPTSASDLPKGTPRSDTISHVRRVQLPPAGSDDTLQTSRSDVGGDSFASRIQQDTTNAPVDPAAEARAKQMRQQMQTNTEILSPQKGVTDVNGTDISAYLSGKPVQKQEDDTVYHFDRPTPANPQNQGNGSADGAASFAPPLPYVYPPTSLLRYYDPPDNENVGAELEENANRLVETLQNFKVGVTVTDVSRGPTITRYELFPDVGVRVRNILNLADDIALSLASSGIRFEAPIPGKQAVGVEVPNRTVATVGLRELLENDTFQNAKDPLLCALGADVAGAPVYVNLAKMPHLLIAGATGTGKSVCINALVASLLFRASPDDVKLILVDPKKVELSVYNGLPHLLIPAVTDPRKAAGALRWATVEMDRRYQIFEDCHVRNMGEYNKLREENPNLEKLPMIVIIIDELADLMQTAPDDVEGAIARLTQLARAAGMHMIIGTQRPSVDVITGKIKSNVPSRIAFTVSSQIDSRTILDAAGAEKLIGRGDMLYAPIGSNKPLRVQGAFISESEVGTLVNFVQTHGRKAEYDNAVLASIERAAEELDKNRKKDSGMQAGEGDGDQISEDEVDLLKQCAGIAVGEGKISASYLQVKLKIGFQKAKRMICYMEQLGIIGAADGQKPREVVITEAEFQEMMMNDDAWANVQI